MSQNLDCVAPNLLCSESSNTSLFDLDCSASNDVFWVILSWLHKYHQDHFEHTDLNNNNGSLMGLPLQTVERIVEMVEMVEKEKHHLPKDDYLKRLRDGVLDMSHRREAVDWIWKANAQYRFGPVTFCLAVNYFHRFLSVHELTGDKAWIMQLVAVACLSIAGKLEEPKVPQPVDLQVGDPKFVFEAKTIQKMELMVLNTLEWRMQASTPCSFIDYFLTKINNDQHPTTKSVFRAVELILSTSKDVGFLEFKPSEIAAAVAIFVSRRAEIMEAETQAIDNAMSLIHVEKEMAMKCVELVKDLSLMMNVNGNENEASIDSTASFVVPNESDDESENTTVESCANSGLSVVTSETKRRKISENSYIISGNISHEN